jgi:CHAT domain-containing protein
MQDDNAYAQRILNLPALPGTEIEAHALQQVLGATRESVLIRDQASKSELEARNTNGSLSRVRVLDLATHALLPNDITDLSEPALVFAHAKTMGEQLLTVTDAAALKLSAEWVLLSACNTASPDAPESEGISGFARAFFYSGAHSLLVSHWRLRDDVAARLLPEIMRLEKAHAGMSKAEAVRQASLAILDDPTLDAASPAAWAPFVLVGEPD